MHIIQVTIPDGPIQRWGHTASAITLRPGLEDIIVFGGCPHNYDVQQSFKDDDRIADTTIITFGEFPITMNYNLHYATKLFDILNHLYSNTY